MYVQTSRSKHSLLKFIIIRSSGISDHHLMHLFIFCGCCHSCDLGIWNLFLKVFTVYFENIDNHKSVFVLFTDHYFEGLCSKNPWRRSIWSGYWSLWGIWWVHKSFSLQCVCLCRISLWPCDHLSSDEETEWELPGASTLFLFRSTSDLFQSVEDHQRRFIPITLKPICSCQLFFTAGTKKCLVQVENIMPGFIIWFH